MLEKSKGAAASSESVEPVVSFKPSKAAVLVDKNSRTIVKILQLQEHLSDTERTSAEKNYSDKDKAILRKICECLRTLCCKVYSIDSNVCSSSTDEAKQTIAEA
jgi:hypothetical protein